MTEERPSWLEELYDTYGEPKIHFVDAFSRYFSDSEDPGRPVKKTGWTWFPSIDDKSVNHSFSIQKGKGFTVVTASTHLRWKPTVEILFSEGYGPSDDDIELILRLSQFFRKTPRFEDRSRSTVPGHETGDLREPGTAGQ